MWDLGSSSSWDESQQKISLRVRLMKNIVEKFIRGILKEEHSVLSSASGDSENAAR